MIVPFTKVRVALAVGCLTLLVPTTALAVHVFDDVDDNRFYSGAVTWAHDHEITTGTSPTTFEPEREITRGEAVTLDYRAWTNLTQPAIEALKKVELSIGSGAFDGDPDVIDGCRGAGELVAGSPIPGGATITGIGALVLNLEAAASLDVHLQRVSQNGTATIATLTVATATGRQRAFVQLADPEVVDDGEHFNLVFSPTAGSATQQICGATIRYSLG